MSSSWDNFLENEFREKPELTQLAEALDKEGPPCIAMHRDKLESRRRLVRKAMDLGIDLTAIRDRGRMLMRRGLLDIWNEEYKKRFGDTFGTAGAKEAVRRNVKRVHNLRTYKHARIPIPGSSATGSECPRTPEADVGSGHAANTEPPPDTSDN